MKSDEQLEREYEECKKNLLIAYQRAYTTAQQVRECKQCDEGWTYYEQYSEVNDTVYEYAARCECWNVHLESLQNMRIARERYRKMNDEELPEPDKKKLKLF